MKAGTLCFAECPYPVYICYISYLTILIKCDIIDENND